MIFLLFSAFLEVFCADFLSRVIQHLMLSHDFTPENHRLPVSEHLLGLVISQLLRQCGFVLVLVEILFKMLCKL